MRRAITRMKEYLKSFASISYNINKMSIATIIGNGAAPTRGKPKTISHDGDTPETSALGGSPWGVIYYQDEVYYTSEEQGYLARVRDGHIEHLVTGLDSPMSFDVDEEGSLYIPEYGADRITVAPRLGRATPYPILEGIVKNPMAVRYFDDKLYVVDTGHHRVISWDPLNNEYEVIAGTGKAGYISRSRDALSSPLRFPIDLDINRRGEIVIADGMNNRLRLVTPEDNMMHTIAGSGPPCYASDSLTPCSNPFLGDGPGLEITLNWVFSPRFSSQGDIWFIDANNNLLRRLTPEGIVETVVGLYGGGLPFPQPQDEYYKRHIADSYRKDVGDGGPLQKAVLYRPMGLSLIERNGIIDCIIADTDNQRIRYVEDASSEKV